MLIYLQDSFVKKYTSLLLKIFWVITRHNFLVHDQRDKWSWNVGHAPKNDAG
jgi:hypothetical protein